jgi:hypothetical protein
MIGRPAHISVSDASALLRRRNDTIARANAPPDTLQSHPRA